MTSVIRVGPMPEPAQAPPAVGLDEVTNGYVPWSTSSRVPWSPRAARLLPGVEGLVEQQPVSAMYGASRSA